MFSSTLTCSESRPAWSVFCSKMSHVDDFCVSERPGECIYYNSLPKLVSLSILDASSLSFYKIQDIIHQWAQRPCSKTQVTAPLKKAFMRQSKDKPALPHSLNTLASSCDSRGYLLPVVVCLRNNIGENDWLTFGSRQIWLVDFPAPQIK